jgi:hypothetical protein
LSQDDPSSGIALILVLVLVLPVGKKGRNEEIEDEGRRREYAGIPRSFRSSSWSWSPSILLMANKSMAKDDDELRARL